MLTLKNKIDQRKVKKDGHSDTRMSVRDVLLVKGTHFDWVLFLYLYGIMMSGFTQTL